MATPHSVERTKEENHLGLSIVPEICQHLIVDVHRVPFSLIVDIYSTKKCYLRSAKTRDVHCACSELSRYHCNLYIYCMVW